MLAGIIHFISLFAIIEGLHVTKKYYGYSLTQATTFVNEAQVIVGRLDGTIALYSAPNLKLNRSVILPEAVTMVARINDSMIASSYDTQSLAIWQIPSMKLLSLSNYQSNNGIANSGIFIYINNTQLSESYFISGHNYGTVIIWKFNGTHFNYINSRNISTDGGLAPYHALNIRGIEIFDSNIVITGGENAKICQIRINNNLTVLNCQLYSSTAQRGINAIAVINNYVLVANCAVGKNDSNLWLFAINGNNTFTFLDAKNLVVNQQATQVFDFSLVTSQPKGYDLPIWFSGTQEGVVWYGNISTYSKKIQVTNYTIVNTDGCEFGYYVTFKNPYLFVAGGNVFMYTVP